MSESCGGNCSSCGESCASRKEESLLAQPNPKSNVKKVIAVVSGKGGVGKSTVTSMLACAMQKLGFRAGILDADITGPSVPKAFGLHEPALGVGLLGARDRERGGARVRERRAVHLVLALLALEERVVAAERLVHCPSPIAQQLFYWSVRVVQCTCTQCGEDEKASRER